MIKIKPPLIRNALLEPCSDPSQVIDQCRTDGQDICLKHFKALSLVYLDLSDLTFEQVVFENCQFDEATLRKTLFRDVVFETCDFSNRSFANSWFHRCELTDCKGVGANFSEVSMNEVAILNCNFRYANFATAKLTNCSISHSELSDTTFTDCTFKTLLLEESRFIGTDFFHTSLRNLDFSSGELATIHVSTEASELKGMIVSPGQAAELARMMGVVIKD
jgi:uncharacterized protein YjbI with pentapeptide repeats